MSHVSFLVVCYCSRQRPAPSHLFVLFGCPARSCAVGISESDPNGHPVKLSPTHLEGTGDKRIVCLRVLR
jgi:hypothetical protein